MLGALTDVPPALSSANDELPIAYGAYGNYLSGRAAETQSEAADAIEYFEAVLDREGASYELIDRIFRLSVGSGDVDRAKSYADELLEMMGLSEFGRSRVTKLSKGMAQKVQILSALAHRPDFLILDEPFSGLDPVNQQALEDLIIEEHKRGATIVFSTHVMEHAERLCEKIVMMARGRKVFDGTLDDAFAALGRAVHIGVADGFDLSAALGPSGFEAVQDGDHWRVSLSQAQSSQDALRATLDSGAPITSFTPQEARLRDVFVSLVSEAEAQDLTDTLAADAAEGREAA